MSVFIVGGNIAFRKASIQSTLSNCSINNNSSEIFIGRSYTATLSLNSGYNALEVLIIMNDIDITDQVYSDGEINIPIVDGNIIITATGRYFDYKHWYFNVDRPSTLSRTTINFRSNRNKKYSAISVTSILGIFTVNYTPTSGSSSLEYAYQNGAWVSEEFRTIVFDSVPTGEFRVWLEENAIPIEGED